jgi:membrane-bound ClpP family serine protease
MAVIYKIRRKSDGLFSMGGSEPHFNKTGKIWKQRGHLTGHLKCVRYRKVYAESEVIMYQLIETILGDPVDIQDYLQSVAEKKAEDEVARALLTLKTRKAQRRNMYNELKREFDIE